MQRGSLMSTLLDSSTAIYNIKARHPNGQYVEIQLDPKTGALVMDPVTGKPRYQTVSRIESDKVTQSRKRHLITQAKEAGYKEVSSIEYDHGYVRNHRPGRTKPGGRTLGQAYR